MDTFLHTNVATWHTWCSLCSCGLAATSGLC